MYDPVTSATQDTDGAHAVTLEELAAEHELTPAETCVLLLMSERPGDSMPVLARHRGSSVRTTQFHASNIYAKLSVINRKGLNTFLVARGYWTAEHLQPGEVLDPAGTYILRLETAIRAWAADDVQQLAEIANELA